MAVQLSEFPAVKPFVLCLLVKMRQVCTGKSDGPMRKKGVKCGGNFIMNSGNEILWCGLLQGGCHRRYDMLSQLAPCVRLLKAGNSALVSLRIATSGGLIMLLVWHMVLANRAEHRDMMGLCVRNKISLIKIFHLFGLSIAGNNTG